MYNLKQGKSKCTAQYFSDILNAVQGYYLFDWFMHYYYNPKMNSSLNKGFHLYEILNKFNKLFTNILSFQYIIDIV